MQQAKIYSPTPLVISGDDLKIEQSEIGSASEVPGQTKLAGYTYTVTHYGEAATVTLKWARD
ncbi:hypothetical protein D3C75_689150 [compost metagenome]